MSPIFEHNISPLTKAKRRIIFYLVVLLFAVVAPFIALYSRGYNFDFKTRQIISTGGILVKTDQAGFKIFINDVLAKQVAFFSYGALVIDLRPDLYSVRIEKDGFKPWQRFVHVAGESVSEFRFVTLIPNKLPEKEILDISKRGLTISSFQILGKSPWVIINTNERKQITYFYDRSTGALDAVESFADWRWDSANRQLLVMRKGPTRWSLVYLGSDKIREEKIVIPKGIGTAVSMDFATDKANEFFILSSMGVLNRFNKSTRAFSAILSEVNVFSVESSKIAFLNKSGFFALADLDGKNIEDRGRKGFYVSEKAVKFALSSAGDNFVIDSGGGFFMRKALDLEVVPISGSVVSAVFDSDGSKAIFCTDHDISVIWLKDEQYQPFRKAGDRVKIISFSGGEITDCDWWGADEENIIFSAGKFVGITDIDTRGGGVSASILFDDIAGTVRFEKNSGNILRSEKSFLFSTKLY
ncbi:MAG: hypothetical protein Q7R91_00540 [bacterium]|nr:hypothetical protein [bacterium]